LTQTLEESSREEYAEPEDRKVWATIITSRKELVFLSILLLLGSAIVLFKFEEVSRASSLEWDSASFLTNAAVYAGFTQYHQALDPTRPPVIPFILSLLFRITGPNVTDGYVLSAVLYLFAILGCFLIAKELMNPFFATLASLSFGLAPFVYQWSGILLSDTEGVAVASLALATLIFAAKRNKKFLLISLTLLVLTPLTRYSLGMIIPVAIIYLVAARKNDWIMDQYEFYYGSGLAILAIVIFGGQWISYPFFNHKTIAVLFPRPNAVNPFESVLGPAFYAFNFPRELGFGLYGVLLAILFGISIVWIIVHFARRGSGKTINPISIALLAWFVLMFGYYSFGWPYSDLRYSIEFVMPVIILAFYGLSILVAPLESRITKGIGRESGFLLSMIPLILISSFMAFVFFQSGLYVAANTQPMEASLNQGVQQAVSWLKSNASVTDMIESNWYTLMWWYAPFYNTSPAPLSYQLTSPSSYQNWQSNLNSNKIAYVVYIDPTRQLIQSMPMLSSVFNITSGSTEVVIFSVH
jgi:4-amino-4-deoxy-L-arabinose transferase-like glycosyltransferase